MEDNAPELFREFSGKSGYQPPAKVRGKKKSGHGYGSRTPAPAKSKQPRASDRASFAAQQWVDHAEARGFNLPYDVNYFALGLQSKIERDPEIGSVIRTGDMDKAERWVAKMIDNWWEHYVNESVTASNAKEMFLGEDWDDLRDWARSNLRKDYLVQHGTRVPMPDYPGSREYAERLQEIHRRGVVEQYLRRLADAPPVDDRPPLDVSARERLRSFANRRRRKTK